MTERDFVYWLNGFLELSGTKILDESQLKMVKDHLKLVMTKVTPQLQPSPFWEQPKYPYDTDTRYPNPFRPNVICSANANLESDKDWLNRINQKMKDVPLPKPRQIRDLHIFC